ncbi:DTW domain-containing protein [Diplonema papillatum]|nr:DTW domain-containing protein [Diplonema papillatum]
MAGAGDEAPPAKKAKVTDDAKEQIIPAEEVKRFIDGLRFTQPLCVLERAAVKQRAECPQCKKNKQYYCYDCLLPTVAAARPRAVPLPVNVHVLLHPSERRGKATSVTGAIVSPDIHLHVYPSLPEGLDPGKTLLVYPSPTAKLLPQLADEGLLSGVENLVFVDSTWQQSKQICRDPKVTSIGRHVQLADYRTLFWRYQNTGDERYLATIEAIYYLLKDLRIAQGHTYNGEFDDILYFYVHQYAVIQQTYREGQRGFTPRHQKADQYIRKEVDFSYLLQEDAGSAAPPPGPVS